MAEPEHRVLKATVAAVCFASLTSACAHRGSSEAPEPRLEPVVATVPVTPPLKRPRLTPPPPAEPSPILVEIEAQAPKDVQDHRSLVEASRAARKRRLDDAEQRRESQSIAVINNQNLDEFAKAGELTFVAARDIDAEAAAENTSGDSGVEEFWRDRSSLLRDDWRRAVDERQDVEDRAALLRRRFYAEDDPFVRDGQIKPEWDQALERLADLRQEEEFLRSELDEFYAEGALAGANPLWLEDPAGDIYRGEPLPEERSPEAIDELEAHEVQNPPF